MITTTFFTDQDESSKTYKSLNVSEVSGKYISRNLLDIASFNELPRARHFNNYGGRTFIDNVNTVYYLDYVKGTCDIVLPKNPKPQNWVVLLYRPIVTFEDFNIDTTSHIKVYGNGKRIMNLDEPLFCDVQFASLRLTFIDDINGWIIT